MRLIANNRYGSKAHPGLQARSFAPALLNASTFRSIAQAGLRASVLAVALGTGLAGCGFVDPFTSRSVDESIVGQTYGNCAPTSGLIAMKLAGYSLPPGATSYAQIMYIRQMGGGGSDPRVGMHMRDLEGGLKSLKVRTHALRRESPDRMVRRMKTTFNPLFRIANGRTPYIVGSVKHAIVVADYSVLSGKFTIIDPSGGRKREWPPEQLAAFLGSGDGDAIQVMPSYGIN